jgi:uncharacterized membrane protein
MKRQGLLLGISCTTVACLMPVLLFQSGVIASLPDPEGELFDSDRIAGSSAARPWGVPDSALGIANFAVTAALVAAAGRGPVWRKALGAKLLVDGGAGAFNMARQWVGFGKLCSWCAGAALAAEVALLVGRHAVSDAMSGNWSGEATGRNERGGRPE